ncbi:MAG: fructose-bisphosphatase class III [Tissierellia bacterium]|nr:fructose-bisphosphatase class III [Tissierellia bacterium]
MTHGSSKYLELLSQRYPTRETVVEAIAMRRATLELPKPTEHFVSDLHGEFTAFTHVLRNASGTIRRYIGELFPKLPQKEQDGLATLIYYPREKMEDLRASLAGDYEERLKEQLFQMILVAKRVASKYDHDHLQSFFPGPYEKLLDTLLLEERAARHKRHYVDAILDALMEMGALEQVVEDVADVTVAFAVEHLHVLGDIYDRGDGAHRIMDFLAAHPRVDIQWGNHDIAWIGAALGSRPLMMSVIRIALRYNAVETIEEAYGISLLPLLRYAEEHVAAGEAFIPKVEEADPSRRMILTRAHKLAALLQFKTEAEVIARNPLFDMDERILLDRVSADGKWVQVEGVDYPLREDLGVDPQDPLTITPEEEGILEELSKAFQRAEKLQRHIRFLIDRGGMYKVINDNLLFHGCIPLNGDGSFKETHFLGENLSGRALLDELDRQVRRARYAEKTGDRQRALDILFYLWCGQDSPLFGKERITTFERYYIEDKNTHRERKNPYYSLREKEEVTLSILRAFGLNSERSLLINGHTPVKKPSGESPIKGGGHLVVIDGGFAPAYRKTTGTAGYTLISNSYGILMAAHKPITQEEALIRENFDITSELEYVMKYKKRRRRWDTDEGRAIQGEIEDLTALFEAYDQGILAEGGNQGPGRGIFPR